MASIYLMACAKNKSDTNINNSFFYKDHPQITEDKIIKQVNEYLVTKYKMINFSLNEEEEFLFPNSVIYYDVYYIGKCVKYSSDEYLLVKLNLKDEILSNESEERYHTFKICDNGEIEFKYIDDPNNVNLYDAVISDTSLERIASGESSIGNPYHLEFEDFDQKDDILKEIKEVIRNRYFMQNDDPVYQPLFYDEAKASEVYVLDFDEGCVKYNEFTMLVYTDDGNVYNGVLYYSVPDQKFYCAEAATSSIKKYNVKELNNAESGNLKYISDYFERVKKYSICVIKE
ncbi:hypothetical protein [Anaerosporobacter sp.]